MTLGTFWSIFKWIASCCCCCCFCLGYTLVWGTHFVINYQDQRDFLSSGNGTLGSKKWPESACMKRGGWMSYLNNAKSCGFFIKRLTQSCPSQQKHWRRWWRTEEAKHEDHISTQNRCGHLLKMRPSLWGMIGNLHGWLQPICLLESH